MDEQQSFKIKLRPEPIKAPSIAEIRQLQTDGKGDEEIVKSIFKEDVLERREHAQAIVSYMRHIESPFTYCLDAPWGHGKTSFLNLLERLLQYKGCVVLRFNAWESDYLPDPFVPLFGQIYSQIRDLYPKGKLPQKAKDVLRRAGAVARAIAPGLLKLGLEAAANYGAPGSVEAVKAVAGAIDPDKALCAAEEAKRLSEKAIEDYGEETKELSAFVHALSELAHVVREDQPGDDLPIDPEMPIVVLVDELDRCRPSFTIEVLERIKHLFSAEGICFIVALDRTQLCHMIRQVYGAQTDADGYLERFFDLESKLAWDVDEGALRASMEGVLCSINGEDQQVRTHMLKRLTSVPLA
ncbi:hypothetical protein H5P28_09030 [Ruficoccus amylovorans]|uniref:KAP NTPase domain-containing protein n=1 Tax=Ruficoccus amylovorans TaxID=1804625 RepID=A0A842HED2_9BACT|nr:P-loop NTPase fold protein [Ruficoccus amylovorans]MBC2594398.1 hypothetical protein [Ruficoccus amylovorans]